MALAPISQNSTLPDHGMLRLIHNSIPANATSPGGMLLLPLPEDIAFGVSSSWESFAEGNLIDFVNKGARFLGGAGEAGAFTYETYARAKNQNAYISSFSHQTWRGTSPLEFHLRITLTAYEDAQKDVMEKLEILTRLSLPQGKRESTNSGVVGGIENTAIGAVRQFDAAASLITAPPRDITLHLGTKLRIPAVVIPQVNISFETKSDVNGNFIFATADISIKSSYTPNSGMFVFESFQSPEEVLQQ